METEIFFEEKKATEFVQRLRDRGLSFDMHGDIYWDLDDPIPCIVVDYIEK